MPDFIQLVCKSKQNNLYVVHTQLVGV